MWDIIIKFFPALLQLRQQTSVASNNSSCILKPEHHHQHHHRQKQRRSEYILMCVIPLIALASYNTNTVDGGRLPDVLLAKMGPTSILRLQQGRRYLSRHCQPTQSINRALHTLRPATAADSRGKDRPSIDGASTQAEWWTSRFPLSAPTVHRFGLVSVGVV